MLTSLVNFPVYTQCMKTICRVRVGVGNPQIKTVMIHVANLKQVRVCEGQGKVLTIRNNAYV